MSRFNAAMLPFMDDGPASRPSTSKSRASDATEFIRQSQSESNEQAIDRQAAADESSPVDPNTANASENDAEDVFDLIGSNQGVPDSADEPLEAFEAQAPSAKADSPGPGQFDMRPPSQKAYGSTRQDTELIHGARQEVSADLQLLDVEDANEEVINQASLPIELQGPYVDDRAYGTDSSHAYAQAEDEGGFFDNIQAHESLHETDQPPSTEQSQAQESETRPIQSSGSANFFDQVGQDVAESSVLEHADGQDNDGADFFSTVHSEPQASMTQSDPQVTQADTAQAEASAVDKEEPFDLDAELGEFDIDAELGDEFAELEKSFQTPSTVASPRPSSPKPKAPYVNPYRPSAEAAAANYQTIQRPQSHLFTPAVAAAAAATSVAQPMDRTNAYAPVAMNQPPRPSPVSPMRPEKPATPSFVNAKSGYTDPYALPDTFVAPKRARPVAHALKNTQSVPNLRDTQQQQQQQHQPYQQQRGPPRAPPMGSSSLRMQAPPPQAGPMRPPTSGRYVSMPQVPGPNEQAPQQPGYMPQGQASGLYGRSQEQYSQMPPPQRQTGPSYGPPQHQPAQQQQQLPYELTSSAPPSRYQAQPPPQAPAAYGPPRPAVVGQSAEPPTSAPRRDSVGSNVSVQSRPGKRSGYSPPALRNVGTTRLPDQGQYHSRQRSSLDYQRDGHRRMSAASNSTIEDREQAMGQYLQQQQGAERTMHMDQFSVVEEDIAASQQQQQGRRSDYAPSRQHSYASQPSSQYAHQQQQQQQQHIQQAPGQGLQQRSQQQAFMPGQQAAAQIPSQPAPPAQMPSQYAPVQLPSAVQQPYAPPRQASPTQRQYTPQPQPAPQPQAQAYSRPPPSAYQPGPPASSGFDQNDAQPEQQVFGRRSLDAVRPKPITQLSRPNSRASSAGRGAMTEPSMSPRLAKNVLQPFTSGGARPAFGMHTADSPRTLDTPHPKARFASGGRLVVCAKEQPNQFSHASAIPRPISVLPADQQSLSAVGVDYVGPLVHAKQNVKQKRADLLTWLTAAGVAAEDDQWRLLYRALALTVEHNGSILQTPAARAVYIAELAPDLQGTNDADDSANFRVPAAMLQPALPDGSRVLSAQTLTDTSLQTMADLLMRGKQTAALQHACEHRLWSHALLIASRLDGDAWISVVREFTQSELAEPSEAADSLTFLYRTLAVRHTGDLQQLGASDFEYGARSWRKALAILLANEKQSPMTLPALANALISRGQVLPSLLCQVLLCKSAPPQVPGAMDDGAAFLLKTLDMLSAKSNAPAYAAALLCAETVELLTVAAQPKFAGFVQLMPHKLQRVQVLGDCGAYSQALRYCDALTATLKQLPRQGHKDVAPVQPAFIEQLKQRSMQLEALTSEEPGAWLGGRRPKGSKMDSLWGSLEGKFNKFIAGDSAASEDAGADAMQGLGGPPVKGPFAHVLPTPTISRIGSAADLTMHRGTASPIQEAFSGQQVPYPPASAEMPYGVTQPHRSYAASPVDGRQVPLRRGTDNAYTSPFMQQQGQRPFSPAGQPQNAYAPQGLGLSRQGSMSGDYGEVEHQSFVQQPQQQRYDYEAGPAAPAANYGMQPPAPQQRYAPAQASPQQRYAPSPSQYEGDYRRGSETTPTMPYQPAAPAVADHRVATPVTEAAKQDDEDDAVTTKQTTNKTATTAAAAAPAAAASPKSTWLGGWFSKKPKDAGGSAPSSPATQQQEASKPGDPPKVHKAKLGEGMSLVYDPVTKKWTNPKGSMPEENKALSAPPPSAASKARPPSNGLSQGQGQAQGSGPTAMGGSGTRPPSAGGAPPPPVARAAGTATISRTLGNADADLASLLGASNNKPRPRRPGAAAAPPAAGGNGVPIAAGGPGGPEEEGEDVGPLRSHATMPRRKARAKGRYVDVFSEDGAAA